MRNDSIHVRKKAIRKARKAQKFAEEIQRQSELRVEELKQRSMGSTSLGTHPPCRGLSELGCSSPPFIIPSPRERN